MQRAYAGYRQDDEVRPAAACALWLARESTAAYGRDAVSAGWLARAEGLLRDAGDVPDEAGSRSGRRNVPMRPTTSADTPRRRSRSLGVSATPISRPLR